MAISTIFINFIVKILAIEKKYPWWLKRCLEYHKDYLEWKVYYDDYLFRDWAMNSIDMNNIVKYWEDLWFKVDDDFCIYRNYSWFWANWLDTWSKNWEDFVFLKWTEPWKIIWII